MEDGPLWMEALVYLRALSRLLLFLVIVPAACAGPEKDTTAGGKSPSAEDAGSTDGPGDADADGGDPGLAAEELPKKCAPPRRPFSFEITGPDGPLPGNEWELAVPRGEAVSVTVDVDIKPGSRIQELRFHLRPTGSPSTGPPLWHTVAGEELEPGHHRFDVTWRGEDDAGKPAPERQYRLFAASDVVNTAPREEPCDPEPGSHSRWGSGLGQLRVIDE